MADHTKRRPERAEINRTAGWVSSSVGRMSGITRTRSCFLPYQSAVSNRVKKRTHSLSSLFIRSLLIQALGVSKMGQVRVGIEHNEDITKRTLHCARHLVQSVGLVVLVEARNTNFLLTNHTCDIGRSILAVTRARPMHSIVVRFEVLLSAEQGAAALI